MNPIRAAIVATLEAVPDIGVVHARERNANDLAKLKQLYFSEPHQDVRGWFVRRVRIRETGILQPRYLEVIDWQIRGVMGFNDAKESELAMDDLVDAVRARFRADPTLGGAITKTGLLGADKDRGLQLVDAGPVLFGGVLCHGVRLDLTTTTERSA